MRPSLSELQARAYKLKASARGRTLLIDVIQRIDWQQVHKHQCEKKSQGRLAAIRGHVKKLTAVTRDRVTTVSSHVGRTLIRAIGITKPQPARSQRQPPLLAALHLLSLNYQCAVKSASSGSRILYTILLAFKLLTRAWPYSIFQSASLIALLSVCALFKVGLHYNDYTYRNFVLQSETPTERTVHFQLQKTTKVTDGICKVFICRQELNVREYRLLGSSLRSDKPPEVTSDFEPLPCSWSMPKLSLLAGNYYDTSSLERSQSLLICPQGAIEWNVTGSDWVVFSYTQSFDFIRAHEYTQFGDKLTDPSIHSHTLFFDENKDSWHATSSSDHRSFHDGLEFLQILESVTTASFDAPSDAVSEAPSFALKELDSRFYSDSDSLPDYVTHVPEGRVPATLLILICSVFLIGQRFRLRAQPMAPKLAQQ